MTRAGLAAALAREGLREAAEDELSERVWSVSLEGEGRRTIWVVEDETTRGGAGETRGGSEQALRERHDIERVMAEASGWVGWGARRAARNGSAAGVG